MKKYLDYYKRLNIVPAIEIKDLKENIMFKQRFNFYFKIGLTPIDFKNKSVLELCAGTGYNAYYLLKHCKCNHITLVDRNPSSLKSLKKNLSKFVIKKKIVNDDIEHFQTKKKFDYVIIENALPGLNNPKKILQKIFEFTKSGGCVILTFSNLEGLFSEKLRYLYSILLNKNKNILNNESRLKFLTDLFRPHLKYLSSNSRKPEKWVLDNILHESWITQKNYFDLLDINRSIKNKYYIRSTSPSFSKNFIWYKNMTIKNNNDSIIKSYLNESINFLDFEEHFFTNVSNRKSRLKLNDLIIKFTYKISKISFNKKLENKQIDDIYDLILKISKILNVYKDKNKITLALNEFLKIILKYKKKKKLDTETKYFHKFWGIGTGSISLHKI